MKLVSSFPRPAFITPITLYSGKISHLRSETLSERPRNVTARARELAKSPYSGLGMNCTDFLHVNHAL